MEDRRAVSPISAETRVYFTFREAFLDRPDVRIAVRDSAAVGLVDVVLTAGTMQLMRRVDPEYRGWTLDRLAASTRRCFG